MEEIKEKKQVNVLALISYIGILCLVPILMKEEDDFVRFHARQGLVLFICEAGTWTVFAAVPFLWFITNLIGLFWLVLSVIGILNVFGNKKQELPVIGKFAEKFKF